MRRSVLISSLFFSLLIVSVAQAQGARHDVSGTPVTAHDRDHVKERSEWFSRGRVVRGQPAAEHRRQAFQAKLQMRRQRAAAHIAAGPNAVSLSMGSWIALGPAPLASAASGNGTQDYRQVAGRVTAVAIDPADTTGNTVYVGAAQGGIWKSVNAAYSVADNVGWTPLTDDQARSRSAQSQSSPGTPILQDL